MQCPYCGSTHLTETFNFNEHSCDRCGCEFKHNDGQYRIFEEGNYEKFCESVLLEMTNATNVQVGNVLVQVIRECKRYGPGQLDVMLDHLKNVAESVLSETQIGRRDNYDFGALVEGVDAFETLGRTLMEREDLEIDLHSFKRYIEYNTFRDTLTESEDDKEYFDDFPQDKEKNYPGDDPDSDYSKMSYGGHKWKPPEEKEITERTKVSPDDEDPDANRFGKKAAKSKSEKGHKKIDKKFGVGPAGRRGARKGDKPKKPWQEEKKLDEADMSAKDTRGKTDWDGSDLPGVGVKTNRAETNGKPHLEEEDEVEIKTGDLEIEVEPSDDDEKEMNESVNLTTSVKYLLETKTLKQIAEETDIDEQLVVEAAALGKTLGELFEADMTAKSTDGKEEFNTQSDDEHAEEKGEGAREDRADPTDSAESLAEELKGGQDKLDVHPEGGDGKITGADLSKLRNDKDKIRDAEQNPEKYSEEDEKELEKAAEELEETLSEYELKDL